MPNLTQLESDEIDYDPNNLLDTLIKQLHLKNLQITNANFIRNFNYFRVESICWMFFSIRLRICHVNQRELILLSYFTDCRWSWSCPCRWRRTHQRDRPRKNRPCKPSSSLTNSYCAWTVHLYVHFIT